MNLESNKDMDFARLVIRLGRILPDHEVKEMSHKISVSKGREEKEKVVYEYANKYGVDINPLMFGGVE